MAELDMVRWKLPALALGVVLLLAGCATPATTPHTGLITVVASTNVYGSIADVIGGTRVKVTSLITDSSTDPHDFQGSARTQLSLSRADVVIENGGGYDPFVDTLLAAANNPGAKLLNVTTISGKTVTADFNEHLWYDLNTMELLVAHLVATYAAIDPDHASYFESNAQPYIGHLASLSGWLAGIGQHFGHVGVIITEPLPGYLVEEAGLTVISPPEFSRAIEAGRDVSPDVLKSTLELVTSKTAGLVIYNTQTAGPQTDQVLTAAQDAGVPVLPVAETLPPGGEYLRWMDSTVSALRQALT
jgi:zinc/manganese transport system substrate-binding protein